MASDLRGKVPPEVEERVEQAVSTFRENHQHPANLALHGVGFYAILKGLARWLRHKRFRGLVLVGVGIGFLLAGHEIEGTPAFAFLDRTGDGKIPV
jgi:hypothetical protein